MNVSFGKRLHELRSKKGWTLVQVAESTGISPGYLSLLERGKRPIPSGKVLNRLARCYGLSLNELAGALSEESDMVLSRSSEESFISIPQELVHAAEKKALTMRETRAVWEIANTPVMKRSSPSKKGMDKKPTSISEWETLIIKLLPAIRFAWGEDAE